MMETDGLPIIRITLANIQFYGFKKENLLRRLLKTWKDLYFPTLEYPGYYRVTMGGNLIIRSIDVYSYELLNIAIFIHCLC